MPTKRRGGTRSSEETAAPKADSNMSTKTATAASPATITSSSSINDIAAILWRKYLTETPQRTLLLDAFMGFLVLLALVEFTYCVTFGSYPFHAFVSAFTANVGQFVLTASLRMQTVEKPPETGKSTKSKDAPDSSVHVSSERAFAEYVFASLVLHFFCVNFLN